MPDPNREFDQYNTHFPPIASDMISVTEVAKDALPKFPALGYKLHVVDTDSDGWDYSNGVDAWRYPAEADDWADH